MSEEKDSSEALLGYVNRRAMEIVALPPERRAAHFVEMRKANIANAVQTGLTEAKAIELADKIDEWVRALVKIIETSGGAQAPIAR